MKVNIKGKRLIQEKLLPFGFKRSGENFIYSTDIADSQLEMTVTVNYDGEIDAVVTDKSDGGEYVLHLMGSAAGSFVGRVRADYESVINEIFSKCYENEIFKTDYANRLIEYVRNQYDREPEFLWKKFPDNAIWRRGDNKKWFAALLTVSGRKLGLDFDEIVEIIDLRMKPDEVVNVVDNKKYFPGWHMNKKNWITIILDGSVDFKEICRRLNDSFIIAGK